MILYAMTVMASATLQRLVMLARTSNGQKADPRPVSMSVNSEAIFVPRHHRLLHHRSRQSLFIPHPLFGPQSFFPNFVPHSRLDFCSRHSSCSPPVGPLNTNSACSGISGLSSIYIHIYERRLAPSDALSLRFLSLTLEWILYMTLCFDTIPITQHEWHGGERRVDEPADRRTVRICCG